MAPLARDVMTAYLARTAGTEPRGRRSRCSTQTSRCGSIASSDRKTTRNPSSGRQLHYWSEQLAGLDDVIALPADHPRPVQQTFHGDRFTFDIDANTHRALADLTRANGVTMFMALHGALAVLMSKLSGADEVTHRHTDRRPRSGSARPSRRNGSSTHWSCEQRRSRHHVCRPVGARPGNRPGRIPELGTCHSNGSSTSSTQPDPRRTHRCSRVALDFRTTNPHISTLPRPRHRRTDRGNQIREGGPGADRRREVRRVRHPGGDVRSLRLRNRSLRTRHHRRFADRLRLILDAVGTRPRNTYRRHRHPRRRRNSCPGAGIRCRRGLERGCGRRSSPKQSPRTRMPQPSRVARGR